MSGLMDSKLLGIIAYAEFTRVGGVNVLSERAHL